MIEIVAEIFKKSNFSVEKLTDDGNVKRDDLWLAIRNNESHFDFYVIWYVEKSVLGLQFIKEHSEWIMDKVLEKVSLPGVDKNTSLLILTGKENIDNDEDEEFYRGLFDIEEDPYFFKKYVLYYTTQQKQLINELIATDNIVDTLNTLIINKNLFKNFKDELDTREKSLYDILTKIYIKIPFMKLNIDKESVPNLRERIETEIPIADWPSINRILELNETSIDLEKLESILKDDEYEL